MKHYTLGFVFNKKMDEILLIRKNRPDWQKGKINGPGGKIEENETPHACVSREIREETGLNIPPGEWTRVGEIINEEWNVQILSTVYRGEKKDAKSMTDESLEWFPIQRIPEQAITNLHWIIPLCREKLLEKRIGHARIEYEG